jgi:chlorophyllase
MVMIDPVDGLDPFGKIHTQDLITPGQNLNFNIPALQLDNHLDPKKDKLGVSCSPAQLSGPRWFDAMQGPIWNVNATQYGHVDCLDSTVGLVGGLMCPSKPLSNKKKYREMLAASITTFLGAMFDGKTDDLSLLEDASKFGVEVEVRQDLKGMAHGDVKPGCTNTGIIV